MTHQFDVTKKSKLDNPKRRAALPPDETLRKLGLTEGDYMADIGCGIGYFSVPASLLVGPKGKVYALDISDEMLAEVRTAALQNNLDNLEPIQVDPYDLKLEPCAVTYAFCCNVLHEIAELDRYLNEIKRILMVHGSFVLVEWEKKTGEWGPPMEDRLGRESLAEKLREHGFMNIEVYSLGPDFYAVCANLG